VLQIISGKFFKSEDRYIHNGKGILFSNYSWISPIETCVATLEPVDHFREISSYVLLYVNQIEKNGVLVRTGDPDILEQFILLATFGLRSYFAPFRDEVSQICRKSSLGSTDQYVPCQFIPRLFEPGINGNQQEVTSFIKLVNKVISLRRQAYTSVMNALKTLRNALLVSNYNIDLSYSMLVYCLEALTQDFDKFSPSWEDYDQDQKKRLDIIFDSLEKTKAKSIREILVSSANLRLRKRFISFITSHITESFFFEEAEKIKIPIRKSYLERSLSNAYLLRSKFVHQLVPILHQLRIPNISRGDVFIWDKEPYLTLSGLLRLTFHVLNNFISSCDSVESEDINWRQELPGVVTMKLAPQYWIGKTKGFDQRNAMSRFSGMLSQICAAISKNEPITDLKKLMQLLENEIPGAKQVNKRSMLAMYWLYNAIIGKDARRPDWEKFLDGSIRNFLTKN